MADALAAPSNGATAAAALAPALALTLALALALAAGAVLVSEAVALAAAAEAATVVLTSTYVTETMIHIAKHEYAIKNSGCRELRDKKYPASLHKENNNINKNCTFQ